MKNDYRITVFGSKAKHHELKVKLLKLHKTVSEWFRDAVDQELKNEK